MSATVAKSPETVDSRPAAKAQPAFICMEETATLSVTNENEKRCTTETTTQLD